MHVALVRLLLVVLVWLPGCSRDPEVAKREHFAKGNHYFNQKEYREAIIEYRNAIKLDPRFGDARFKLAEAYFATDDRQNALREFVRAGDLLPDNLEVQLRTGNVLLVAGRFEEAKAVAEKLLKKNAAEANAQILFGYALAGLRNLDAAIEELEKALTLDPSKAALYANIGDLQLAKGQLREAEAAFKNAVAVAPKSVNAHLASARFYWSARRPAEAEGWLKSALELEPANPLTLRALAMFYLVTGRPLEAERYLKALAEQTGLPGPRLALADYYVALGRRDEAAKLIKPLSGDSTVGAAAKQRLASIAYAENQRADAHRLVDELLHQNPKNTAALLLKSRFLLTEGSADDALERVKTAVAIEPQSAGAQHTLGLAYAAVYDIESAAAAFSEAAKLNRTSVVSQLELARLRLANGQAEAGLAFAQAAVQLQPNNRDARLMLARARLAAADLAEAEAEAQQLVTQYPDWEPLHSLLGTILLARRDLAAARRQFERAAQLDGESLGALRGVLSVDVMSGRFDEALKIIDTRLASRPSDARLLLMASEIHAARGDLSKAEQTLLKVVENDPDSLAAFSKLGHLYLQRNSLDQALKRFDQIAKARPKLVGPHIMVAYILHIQNRLPEAQQRYERALELDPGAAVAANNLAWLYAEQGDKLEVALQLAQTARRKLPDQPEVNDTLGWVFYKMDLQTQAIVSFQQSVKADPKNAVYHYHLGLAYAKTGDEPNARRALEQALKLKPDFDGSAEARRVLGTLTG